MFLSKNIFLILFFSILVLIFSCKKDDPEIANEEELITTLTYTLTAASKPTVVLSFKDLDGEGGNNPIITAGKLAKNTVYEGKIELLNEITGENITEEVKAESEKHQFFFSTTSMNSVIYYADFDTTTEKNPLGIQTTLTTTEASIGKLKITLRHQLDKNAEGVKTGNSANAGGETDIEVEFPITIE